MDIGKEIVFGEDWMLGDIIVFGEDWMLGDISKILYKMLYLIYINIVLLTFINITSNKDIIS
jgi:hypothetical protein